MADDKPEQTSSSSEKPPMIPKKGEASGESSSPAKTSNPEGAQEQSLTPGQSPKRKRSPIKVALDAASDTKNFIKSIAHRSASQEKMVLVDAQAGGTSESSGSPKKSGSPGKGNKGKTRKPLEASPTRHGGANPKPKASKLENVKMKAAGFAAEFLPKNPLPPKTVGARSPDTEVSDLSQSESDFVPQEPGAEGSKPEEKKDPAKSDEND